MKKILLTAILLIVSLTIMAQRVHDYNPQTRGEFNVLDYGADPTGATESTTAIQAAVTACDSGIVYIPTGFYVVENIRITNSNIKIKGDGRGLTKLVLKADADNGQTNPSVFYLGDADGVTFTGLELDGNGQNQHYIDNRSGATTARCNGISAKDTVYNSIPEGYVDDIIIEDCYIHNFTKYGIFWLYGNRMIVRNCDLSNNYWAGLQTDDYSYNGVFSNLKFDNTAVTLMGSNHIIEGCFFGDAWNDNFWGTSDDALTLESSIGKAYPHENIVIRDCVFSGDSTRIAIHAYNSPNKLTIENVIIDMQDVGPEYGYSYALRLVDDTATVIDGLRIYNYNYSGGVGVYLKNSVNADLLNINIDEVEYIGIYFDDAKDCKLRNSFVYNYHGNPSLSLTASASGNVLMDNILWSVGSSSPIVDSGTGNIWKNNYNQAQYITRWLPETNKLVETGTITDATGITVAMLSDVIYYSEDGATDISANPQIADGKNGQKITIIGSSDSNTLTLDDGTGLALTGQSVLGLGDSITLVYSSGLDLWVEISRSNN